MTPDCLGIQVHYRPRFKGISDSRGVWRWKKIIVGTVFTQFPMREQAAILLHEAGHCKLFHVEKRILNLWRLFWRPASLVNLCIQQEFEADRFAAGCGYGPDLARAFCRISNEKSLLHPPLEERVDRLIHYQ